MSQKLVIVIIAVLFVGWLININQRECSRNKDCSSDEYCGSDFSCHSYPAIQNNAQSNLLLPSIILGIAIVAAAIIFGRNKPNAGLNEWHNQPPLQQAAAGSTIVVNAPTVKAPEEVEEITEPYYKSDNNVEVP